MNNQITYRKSNNYLLRDYSEQILYIFPLSYKDPTGLAPQKEQGDKVLAVLKDPRIPDKYAQLVGLNNFQMSDRQMELALRDYNNMNRMYGHMTAFPEAYKMYQLLQLFSRLGSNESDNGTGEVDISTKKGLQVLDETSKQNLINGLPEEVRHLICFDKDGFLDKNHLAEALKINQSDNLISLFLLTISDRYTTLCTSTMLEFKDDKGNKTIIELEKNTSIKGFTATPTEKDGFGLSINPNTIEVTINTYIDNETQIAMTAHELFIHSLFYSQGLNPNHFDIIDGVQIRNDKVNMLVDPVENEAIKNYKRESKNENHHHYISINNFLS